MTSDTPPAHTSPADTSSADTSPADTSAAAGVPARTPSALGPSERLAVVGGHWGLLLFLGVLSVIAGVMVLAWPEATVLVVAVVFGLQLFVNGLFRLVQAFAAEATGGERVLLALIGVLSILVGVLCLRNILQTIAVLTLLLGAFWLVSGIIEVITAIGGAPHPHRGWQITSGLLGVIAGILVLAYPGISLGALILVLGIWLVIYGGLFIGLALRLRRRASQVAYG